MDKRKPLWDVLSENRKKQVLDRIIGYYQDVRGEQLGYIAAEDVLDVITEEVFADIYNKGVLDAQKLIREKVADTDAELDALIRLKYTI